jgi:hypothetical protein
MVRRNALAASTVALCASVVVMMLGAADAVADSSTSNRGRSNSDKSTPGRSNQGDSGWDVPGSGPSSHDRHDWHDWHDPRADSNTDVREDVDQPPEAPSSPTAPGDVSTPEPSQPVVTSTSSSGTAAGGPTVGGGPATTGAAGTEAVSASTAPTPPNGAELSAAGSPAPAVLLVEAASDDRPVASPLAPPDQGRDASASESPTESPSASPSESAVPDFIEEALGAATPGPAATGLSPDSAQSGVLVAILAFAVLLFLAAHQLGGRRDRGLAGARDAEVVARFK